MNCKVFTEKYCTEHRIEKLPGPRDWVQILQDQIKLARRRLKRGTIDSLHHLLCGSKLGGEGYLQNLCYILFFYLLSRCCRSWRRLKWTFCKYEYYIYMLPTSLFSLSVSSTPSLIHTFVIMLLTFDFLMRLPKISANYCNTLALSSTSAILLL